jgi:chemotaxis response regulator CheB
MVARLPGELEKTPMASRVPVLIVGEAIAMRSTFSRLFASNPHWEVCGEVTTGKKAVAKISELSPQVVVFDGSRSGVEDVLAFVHEIRQFVPTIKFVLVAPN